MKTVKYRAGMLATSESGRFQPAGAFPRWNSVTLELFGATAQILHLGFAVVLGQDPGCSAVDELVEIGASRPIASEAICRLKRSSRTSSRIRWRAGSGSGTWLDL